MPTHYIYRWFKLDWNQKRCTTWGVVASTFTPSNYFFVLNVNLMNFWFKVNWNHKRCLPWGANVEVSPLFLFSSFEIVNVKYN